MARHSDKRERLLSSADNLILRQGFRQTTLADIAEDSGVPLGNVYYYFKTKQDIGNAIILSRQRKIRQVLDRCERFEQPRQRLLAFLDHPLEHRSALTASGCPLGTLAYELSHADGTLRDPSRQLIQEVLNWATKQFELMNVPDAKTLGLQFLSNLQGMSLIANTLDDPAVIDNMVEQTRAWLEQL